MNLNDLPDEMLCAIFDNLDVYELKQASLVCRRWSELTFSGRRMDRVCFVNNNCKLFKTKRNYRKVYVSCYLPVHRHFEDLVSLLHTLKPYVRMLDIRDVKTWEQIGSILLEVPALQYLAMDGLTHRKYRKNNAPCRVLPELKSLNRRQRFSFFRANISNLQCLVMSCTTDFELDAWKILSGQLKLVHVFHWDRKYLYPFLELTFPRLEDLLINMVELVRNEEMALAGRPDFFRRHPFLRRLFVSDIIIPVEWVESITHHCPELSYLYLFLKDPNEGFLDSLVHLRKLKHLSLRGQVDRKILRGAIKSLESIKLDVRYPRVLLENFFEVVPRLSCLKFSHDISYDEVQFICENFSCLRHLKLSFLSSAAYDSVRIDKLMHLQEFTLWASSNIRSIHRNNVRCLTILHSTITDDDLYQIPEKFPLLKRLILKYCSVSVVDVERLHKLMPSCRIDYDGKRFYPIDGVTAN